MSHPVPEGLFRERGAPAEESVIQEVETELGATLPEEYRAFLLDGDGGVLTQPCMIKRTYYFALGEFFSAGDGGPCDQSIMDVWGSYVGRMPDEFIPVVGDAAGNMFCIGISGEYRGQIYAWDQEFEVKDGGEATTTNMHPLADNFNDFLDILKA